MIINFNVWKLIQRFSIYQLEGGEISGGNGGAGSAPAAVSTPSATPDSPPATPATTPSTSNAQSGASTDKMAPLAADDFSIEKYADRPVKVKINGQEKEVPLSRVIQDYQREQAAQEKFAKASEIQKQNEAMIAAFTKNPAEALRAFGIDPVQFSQKQLEDYIKSKEESPEQAELRELKAFKAATDKDKADFAAKQEQEQQIQAVNAAAAELETKIIDSMTKHNLPRDPQVVSMIADYMARGMEEGYTVTAEMATALVREDLQNNYRHMISQMAPEHLYGFMGDDVAKKIREYELSKLKTPTPPPTPAYAENSEKNTPAQKKGETLAQFNRRLRLELSGE